jgi:hypothetical protein
MLMHLHFEEIPQHLLDEKQLMPLDQLLDIQLLILLLHQNPTHKTIHHQLITQIKIHIY